MRYNSSMLKRVLSVVVLLIISNLHVSAQSAISIIRGFRAAAKRPVICRRITAPISHFNSAANVALLHHNAYLLTNTNIACQIEIKVPVFKLESPTKVFGSYNMLRAVSAISRENGTVAKQFIHDWKHINQTGAWNGAHHVINKSTLKLIHEDSKSRYGHYTFNLKEAQNNAPAIFHPLHGDPQFTLIFHNSFKQYQWYIEKGMKYSLEKQIEMIQDLNDQIGIPKLSDDVINGLMVEAKFWCEIHHLRWE